MLPRSAGNGVPSKDGLEANDRIFKLLNLVISVGTDPKMMRVGEQVEEASEKQVIKLTMQFNSTRLERTYL